MRQKLLLMLGGVTIFTAAGGCGGDDKKKNLDDEAGVQDVVDAFIPSLQRITEAGLSAKDTAAQGANIPEIVITGLVSGTAAIGGTVAQSSGENENLSLFVGMTAYSDTGGITFTTDNTSEATKLQFDLQISNQPQDNTMGGTIVGDLTVDGDVEGTGAFDLDLASDLNDENADPFIICTHVTGTVTLAEEEPLVVDFVLPLDSAGNPNCASL